MPYEGKGLAGSTVGGETGLCGISCGALTMVEFVGKNSPNPSKQLFNDDWNNFAPSVGFSWSLPWFGKDKTVLRGGYGWSYTGRCSNTVSMAIRSIRAALPGTFEGFGEQRHLLHAGELSVAGEHHSADTAQFAPLQPSAGRQPDETFAMGATNRVAPYIQNFNFELQREIGQNLTLDVAYVGTKGTKLWGGVPLNTVDIFKNGFLDAFNTTRAGGNAQLFDQMLRGLNLGAGVVNGTTVTGSASLRAYTNTRAFIANGSLVQLADFLNRSTSMTGQGGGFVRNSGLFPENFFVLNPQFNVRSCIYESRATRPTIRCRFR